MKLIGTIPAGIRLDAWPTTLPSKAPEDSPEVAEIRQELRKSMPQVVAVLDVLAKLQTVRDLAGRLAGLALSREPSEAKGSLCRT